MCPSDINIHRVSSVCVIVCVFYVPGYFFNESLHGDGELTEEAFDDRSTFRKLVLYLDVQDVCHQRYKRVFLQRGKYSQYILNCVLIIYCLRENVCV